MRPEDSIGDMGTLWIFGYGSLVWKPDFKYKRRRVGYIRGYKRRFWHGDNFHRGDENTPGRVVTLVEDDEACVWGVAYEVSGCQVQDSLSYLNVREVVLGGYITKVVDFTPRHGNRHHSNQNNLHDNRDLHDDNSSNDDDNSSNDDDDDGDDEVTKGPVRALVYMATEDNPIYLGPAPADEIAAQIATCRGRSGHNIEYLLRLAEFMRSTCPEVEDAHLYDIEAAALALLL